MESSTPSLSIESFSHSWLVKPSSNFESLDRSSCGTSFDASDEAFFIEMDPKMPPSRRFSRVPKDFSFDFRTSQLPVTLADADDLISADGVLMPLFGDVPSTNNTNMECPYQYLDGECRVVVVPEEPTSASPSLFTSSLVLSTNQKEKHPSNRVRCASLRRCKRLSKRIFQKYLDLLRPLCQKLRGRGSCTSRVASVSSTRGVLMYERHDDQGRSCENYSPATSPRTSVAWSADNWRRSCDSESSIYEAVLHCKRTHGN